ncbi:DUF5643 domain-containing protein [Paenibacillus sp. p3-SID867]|uniref:DUF5643 domain-containing protein n=1 Tax=Paenibacillus sp. p3-SID867 TaxID=2916363 RepID=UPI0021A6ACF7|nr:DUF5643 domain-containing protein [Paenibacillus sp. p3-SID867]MCT1400573.1 DUF5643 domain-containing protein [Paenibacillus sp. p3-SID867]
MKTIYKVMSSVALTSMLLGGAVWGTAQAASITATKPQASKSLLQDEFKAASDTQQGITLGVSKALYDGNHVKVELKRSGKELPGSLTGGKWDEQMGEYVHDKGSIRQMDVFIDNKSIHEYGGGDLAKRPSVSTSPGTDPNHAVIILSDASLLGDDLEAFPDKFKLTAKIDLEGVQKPFTLEIPIQKMMNKPVVLQPNIIKKMDDLRLTLKQVHSTAHSTRIQFVLKGGHDSTILYDYFDDQGNELERISGRGTDENNKNGDYYYDFILEAPEANAKSIVMKPFTPEFKDPHAASGEFKLDKNGEIVKNHLKDLELIIPIK